MTRPLYFLVKWNLAGVLEMVLERVPNKHIKNILIE